MSEFYQYRSSVSDDNQPSLSGIKAVFYIFKKDGSTETETHMFYSHEELCSYANKRAAYLHHYGHQMKVRWEETVTFSGSIAFL